jgi:hypothetical protein
LALAGARWGGFVFPIRRGLGDGTFLPAVLALSYPSNVPRNAFLAEMDGLPGNDLVVIADDSVFSTTMVHVHSGLGAATFGPAVVANMGSKGWADLSDMNGDGIPDLVIATFAGVAIREAAGDGSFEPASVDTSVGPCNQPVAADFDGDGSVDFAVSTFFDTGDLWFFKGDGSGAFSAELVVGQNESSHIDTGIAVADMNADGRPDLIDFNSFPMGVEICINHTYAAGDAFAYLGNVFDYQDGTEHVSPIHVVDGQVQPGQVRDVVTAERHRPPPDGRLARLRLQRTAGTVQGRRARAQPRCAGRSLRSGGRHPARPADRLAIWDSLRWTGLEPVLASECGDAFGPGCVGSDRHHATVVAHGRS